MPPRVAPFAVAAVSFAAACASFPSSPRVASRATSHPAAPAVSWRTGAPLPSARDHHATFAATTPRGSFLYVAGGARGRDFLADVYRARIGDGGAIDSWEAMPPLPGARAGMGVVAEPSGPRRVVLVAGKARAAKESTRDVFCARIDEGGALGTWREGPPLPAPRFHLTATLVGDRVYAIGGLGDDMTATATVYRADLAQDGALVAWSEARALPGPRSHHAAFAHGGFLYVAGGLRGNPTDDDSVTRLADVIRAEVKTDGSLGEWLTVSTLDAPLATHAATVVDDEVYVIGGLETDVTATIRRATLGAGGAVSAFSKLVTPLPRARAHMHQVPVLGANLFVTGGNAGGHFAIADVTVGTLR